MAQAGFASLAELVGASRRLAFSSETLPLALGTGPGYVPRGCGGPTLTAWDERTTLVCLAGTTMTGEAIFIGYRRDDTADVAGRLHEHLARRFGSRRVFMDVDNLRPGVDFGEYIKTVLPRCRVALILIGPQWLSAKDENGDRRLDDPNDWVRIEVETALATPGLDVVPVLTNGARMPDADELPSSLQPILRRHAAIIRRNPDFNDDVSKLIEALSTTTTGGLTHEQDVEARDSLGRVTKRFRAFISHSRTDRTLARRLHAALESYTVPKDVGVGDRSARDRKIGRIFRDDNEVASNAELGITLRDALRDSQSLIVLCSPAAAKSKWVNEEVRWFKATGAPVFAVIVGGTPNADNPDEECFPPSLRFKVYADGVISDEPDAPTQFYFARAGFDRIRIWLAAGLVGAPFDILRARHASRNRVRTIFLLFAVLALAGLVWLLMKQ